MTETTVTIPVGSKPRTITLIDCDSVSMLSIIDRSHIIDAITDLRPNVTENGWDVTVHAGGTDGRERPNTDAGRAMTWNTDSVVAMIAWVASNRHVEAVEFLDRAEGGE